MKRLGYIAAAFAIGVTFVAPMTAEASKMKFTMPERLDRFVFQLRIVRTPVISPDTQSVLVQVSNVDGVVYSEILPAGSFVPNANRTVFKFKRKRDKVTPMIFAFIVKRKPLPGDVNRWVIKPKMEGDFWRADPLRNTELTEADLSRISVSFTFGSDDLYPIDAREYERRPKNPAKPITSWVLRNNWGIIAP